MLVVRSRKEKKHFSHKSMSKIKSNYVKAPVE